MPLVITAYKNDPLVHGAISFSLTKDLLQSGPRIIEHVKEFPTIPLLVLQGSTDRIVNPTATQQFAKNVTGDKTFVMWDGGYHELHNEPEKEQILKILVDWLDKHNTLAFS
ncbi:MAG: alpha/beta hydrolase [Planctomycetes bacterium]|nr:alpha/beta hydrolase [Planctomycetota bacterium]